MNKEQLITKIKEQANKIAGEFFIVKGYSSKEKQIGFICNGDYILLYDFRDTFDAIDLFLNNVEIKSIDIMDKSSDLEEYNDDYLEELLYSMINNCVDIELTMKNKF